MDTSKKRILVVFPRFGGACNPDAGGAENRTYHLLEQLTQEFGVLLLEPNVASHSEDHSLPIERHTFRQLTPQFLTDFNPSFIFQFLRTLRTANVDAVQVESLGGLLASILMIRVLSPATPVVYGSHNVEADRVKDALDPELPFYKRLAAPVIISVTESVGARLADHVVAVSNKDRDTFIQRYGLEPPKVTTVRSGTNSLDEEQIVSQDITRERYGIPKECICIVFHGTYSNYANREAVKSLRSEIAPEICRKHDNVRFVIAGKNIPDIDSAHVQSLGFVEDLDSLLSAMDIAAVPLTSGGGTKLKIFDYIRVGLPIVSTKKGIEGINITNGQDALIVEDVGCAFINALERVILDDSIRSKLKHNTLTLSKKTFSWKESGRAIRQMYNEIL